MDERTAANASEHQLVRQARLALEKIDAELAAVLRRQEERKELQRRGVRLKPELSGLYRRDVREGGVIVPPSDVMSVVVTRAIRSRALSFAGALIEELIAAGMSVWLRDGKTRVGTKPVSFAMRISEVVEKRPGATTLFAPDGWAATGRLRVTLREGSASEFRIRDEGSGAVESKAADLVAYVKRTVDRAQERAAMYAEQRPAYEATVKAKEDNARKEAEEKFVRVMEAARAEDLLHESLAWQRAEAIRRYAEAVASGKPEDKRVQAWAAWALQVADAMDPTERRIAQIETGSSCEEPSE